MNALERFRARRSGRSPEYWIGRASLAGAGAADVSADLERRFGDLRRALDRAHFGGEQGMPGGEVAAGQVLAFAEAAVKEGL